MSNARNLADLISGAYALNTTIAAGGVGSTELATGAVIDTKIAVNAVTETKIANGAVTANKLAAGVINYPVTSVNGETGAVTVSSTKELTSQLFVSSGTWTCPTGATKVKATVIGGGRWWSWRSSSARMGRIKVI